MSIFSKNSTNITTLAKNFNDATKQAKDAVENQGGGVKRVEDIGNWIKNAADSAMSILDKARGPVQSIPPILMLCRLKYLPGLSATALTAMVIQELAENGFITEVNYDGTPNDVVKFVQCLITPLVQHIKDNAAVQGVLESPTGFIPFIGGVQ